MKQQRLSSLRFTPRSRQVLRRIGVTAMVLGLAACQMGCHEMPRRPSVRAPHVMACDDISHTFTMVGSSKDFGHRDGLAESALFFSPEALIADADGNIYMAEDGANDIRKISASGAVSTLAGSSEIGFRDGPSATAQFDRPTSLAIDKVGTIYVADWLNDSVRKVSPRGDVTTFAGGQRGPSFRGGDGKEHSIATVGWLDGKGKEATFNQPRSIALDDSGNAYVTDSGSNTIRKISADGVVTTIAGRQPGAPSIQTGYVDGPAMSAKLNRPWSVVVDHSGNLFFADANQAIRKISTQGVVSTLAGGGRARFTLHPLFPNLDRLFPKGGFRDGVGDGAEFSGIVGMSIDQAGNILVAQVGPSSIRLVTPEGVVRTLLGPSQNCSLGQFLNASRVGDQVKAVTWLPDGRIAFAVGSVVMIEK